MQLKSIVLRGGKDCVVPFEDIVPGDIVMLKSGDNIPADCMVINSKDLFVNEATLTGESYPVEKSVCILPKETVMTRKNKLSFCRYFYSKWYCKGSGIKNRN